MKLAQHTYQDGGWSATKSNGSINPAVVLCFGKRQALAQTPSWYEFLKKKYPGVTIVSASTAGEINNEAVLDNSIVATAIEFEHVQTAIVTVNIKDAQDSADAGKTISNKLKRDGLRFVLVLSDGSLVNGGDLVIGINESFQNKVQVAGGRGPGPARWLTGLFRRKLYF